MRIIHVTEQAKSSSLLSANKNEVKCKHDRNHFDFKPPSKIYFLKILPEIWIEILLLNYLN